MMIHYVSPRPSLPTILTFSSGTSPLSGGNFPTFNGYGEGGKSHNFWASSILLFDYIYVDYGSLGNLLILPPKTPSSQIVIKSPKRVQIRIPTALARKSFPETLLWFSTTYDWLEPAVVIWWIGDLFSLKRHLFVSSFWKSYLFLLNFC